MAVPTSKPGAASSVIAPTRDERGGRLSYPARARLAVEIFAAYAKSRRALRRAPIATVLAELRAQTPSVNRERDSLEQARSLGWVVARVLAYVPGDTRCLVRSLVLTRLLASRGIEAKLVIGARTTPEFLAHAWVELNGTPVLDPGDGSYGRLVEL